MLSSTPPSGDGAGAAQSLAKHGGALLVASASLAQAAAKTPVVLLVPSAPRRLPAAAAADAATQELPAFGALAARSLEAWAPPKRLPGTTGCVLLCTACAVLSAAKLAAPFMPLALPAAAAADAAAQGLPGSGEPAAPSFAFCDPPSFPAGSAWSACSSCTSCAAAAVSAWVLAAAAGSSLVPDDWASADCGAAALSELASLSAAAMPALPPAAAVAAAADTMVPARASS